MVDVTCNGLPFMANKQKQTVDNCTQTVPTWCHKAWSVNAVNLPTFILLSFPFVSRAGNLPRLLNLPSFPNHFIFDPDSHQSAHSDCSCCCPYCHRVLTFPACRLSRSYQMLSDGTTGAPSNQHSDTICLSGKEDGHLPPTLPFYLPVPSTAGMTWGKPGALSVSWILASSCTFAALGKWFFLEYPGKTDNQIKNLAHWWSFKSLFEKIDFHIGSTLCSL